MFPELLFSRFPNRTTHTFKDLLEGVDGGRVGNGHWKRTDLWMGGSRENIGPFLPNFEKGDRCTNRVSFDIKLWYKYIIPKLIKGRTIQIIVLHINSKPYPLPKCWSFINFLHAMSEFKQQQAHVLTTTSLGHYMVRSLAHSCQM